MAQRKPRKILSDELMQSENAAAVGECLVPKNESKKGILIYLNYLI